jgi:hypothetical protein
VTQTQSHRKPDHPDRALSLAGPPGALLLPIDDATGSSSGSAVKTKSRRVLVHSGPCADGRRDDRSSGIAAGHLARNSSR